MKTLATFSLALLTSLSSVALAQEPATVEVHGGESGTVRIDTRAGGPKALTFHGYRRKTEKGSFLGLSTSSVSPALRSQLTLPKGMGLVVESIDKDSPAEKAGLQKYDVLQKLNDQLLINPQQFQVLVRSFDVGDEITLTALRKGQPLTVKATLVEKEVPEFGALGETLNVETLPLPAVVQDGMFQWDGEGNPFGDFRGNGNANAVYKDQNQTIQLTNKDGTRHLVVKDKEDSVIFDGPIDTEEQRKALPEGVSEKLERLEGKVPLQRWKSKPK